MREESGSHRDGLDATLAPTRGRRPLNLGRKVLFSVLAIMLSIVVVEGVCSLLLGSWDLFHHPARPRESPHMYDPELGWTHIPSKRHLHLYARYGEGITLSINSLGFRGGELEPKGDRYRIVALGDSFVLGHGAGDRESFPAVLEKLNPAIQVVNMGQSGYGLGQATLWFERDGVVLNADLVILGFINGDLNRTVDDMHSGRGKPRFSTENGQLVISNRPVPKKVTGGLMPLSEAVRRFSTGRVIWKLVTILRRPDGGSPVEREEKYQTAALVIARLKQVCDAHRTKLVVVRIPEGLPALANVPKDWAEGRQIVAFLRSHPETRGIPILDLTGEFKKLTVPELAAAYSDDRWHLSAKGNALVAGAIDRWLKTIDPAYPRSRAPRVRGFSVGPGTR